MATALALPASFIFSASSLQDYVDCPRRFELRYLQHCDWPAVETEPVLAAEQHMERGRQFHRLLQQHALGLPTDLLTAVAANAGLEDWWSGFLDAGPSGLPDRRLAEITLTVPAGGYRLVAQYDLLALGAERTVILDWKTSVHRPRREWLQSRLQTRVYPRVLAQAGQQLQEAKPVPADGIEMVYWFANFPRQPEVFRFTTSQFAADSAYLDRLIREIALPAGRAFPQAADARRCRFCVYRSLCEREVDPAAYDDEEADLAGPAGLSVDLDQIAEIVY